MSEEIEEFYEPLYDDLLSVSKKYGYEVSFEEEFFYIFKSIENAYIDFDEGVCIREFPSNCAWLILYEFKNMKYFEIWLNFCKEVAEVGEYAGILFSLNDSQLKFSPNLDNCVRLFSQYNAHSWETVHLFLYPLQEITK